MPTIKCPKCGLKRVLARQVEWRIRTGRSDGTCQSCANGGTNNHKGLSFQKNPTARPLMYSRFYWIWVGMRARCNNPKRPRYEHYGGRGISVCERWDNFEAFVADMYPTYKTGLTIDRIDNDGNYELGNCRWATNQEQANNKQNTRYLTYQGRTLSQMEWAKETGISYGILSGRLNLGWSTEKALSTPVTKYRPHRRALEYQGRSMSIGEWAKETELTPHIIANRLHKGWTVERTLSQRV